MELIYILTYNCNFRCKYCDINKHVNNISKKVIDQSLIFLEKNNFNIEKVKFFGWEPLLKKDYIKYIVTNFPKNVKKNFYITTNATLIEENFMLFARNNNIKLTFSIDWNSKTIWINRITKWWKDLSNIIIKNTKKYNDFIRINQVITSNNSKDFFANFKFIYDLWVRKFNFLPEYYSEWSKQWLKNLNKWFNEIFNFYKEWNQFELVNLENYSNISFFNLWLIIDTDWSIYWTNLILSWVFEKYKKDLILWNIFSENYINFQDDDFIRSYIDKTWNILEIEYSKNILNSVKYVDLMLNNFCNKMYFLWNIKD